MPQDKIVTLKQKVHDGDTINVRGPGNWSSLPRHRRGRGFSTNKRQRRFSTNERRGMETYLSNPFAKDKKYESSFSLELHDYLVSKFSDDAGNNQHRNTEDARKSLINLFEQDMKDLDQSKEELKFFIYFVFEVMDRYGRLLGYINRNQPSEEISPCHPHSSTTTNDDQPP